MIISLAVKSLPWTPMTLLTAPWHLSAAPLRPAWFPGTLSLHTRLPAPPPDSMTRSLQMMLLGWERLCDLCGLPHWQTHHLPHQRWKPCSSRTRALPHPGLSSALSSASSFSASTAATPEAALTLACVHLASCPSPASNQIPGIGCCHFELQETAFFILFLACSEASGAPQCQRV